MRGVGTAAGGPRASPSGDYFISGVSAEAKFGTFGSVRFVEEMEGVDGKLYRGVAMKTSLRDEETLQEIK